MGLDKGAVVAECSGVTQYMEQYTDKCIPKGERTACVAVFYFPAI